MKRKDMILIIIVVFISGIVALFITNIFIGTPKNRQEKVEVVEPISADFKQPDSRYFNEHSIDPTQVIRIGEKTNDNLFNKQ